MFQLLKHKRTINPTHSTFTGRLTLPRAPGPLRPCIQFLSLFSFRYVRPQSLTILDASTATKSSSRLISRSTHAIARIVLTFVQCRVAISLRETRRKPWSTYQKFIRSSHCIVSRRWRDYLLKVCASLRVLNFPQDDVNKFCLCLCMHTTDTSFEFRKNALRNLLTARLKWWCLIRTFTMSTFPVDEADSVSTDKLPKLEASPNPPCAVSESSRESVICGVEPLERPSPRYS